MSFIHLLFPPGEFEFPDHAWQEVVLSTRRRVSEEAHSGWRNLGPLAKRRCTGHRQSMGLNEHSIPEHVATWRMRPFHSQAQSRLLRKQFSSARRWSRSNQSECSTPPSYWPEANTPGSAATAYSVGESTRSPSTISTESDLPSSPDYDRVDIPIPSTPGSVCDRFRSGPFGHIFDGLRLTDQERDFLEELTQPTATESRGQQRRAPTAAEIVQTLSQMTYADFMSPSSNSDVELVGQIPDDGEGVERERERDKNAEEPEALVIPERMVTEADDEVSEKTESPAKLEIGSR